MSNPFQCDDCGRFIPYRDLEEGAAIHKLLTPQSAYTREEWITVCGRCASPPAPQEDKR